MKYSYQYYVKMAEEVKQPQAESNENPPQENEQVTEETTETVVAETETEQEEKTVAPPQLKPAKTSHPERKKEKRSRSFRMYEDESETLDELLQFMRTRYNEPSIGYDDLIRIAHYQLIVHPFKDPLPRWMLAESREKFKTLKF